MPREGQNNSIIQRAHVKAAPDLQSQLFGITFPTMHLHDLTPYNTLGLGSAAPVLLRYRTPDQLPGITDKVARASHVFVLGGGSNVVLTPTLDSQIIKIESSGIRLVDESDSHYIVQAEAGEPWHGFVSYCVAQGWGGLENLALIPGLVGAAPVQNIGAYGVELDQRLHSIQAWDLLHGRLVDFAPSDCQFSYRNSLFKQSGPGRWIILTVRFALPKQWRPVLDYPDLRTHPVLAQRGAAVTARDVFDAVCQIRQHKLPDPAVLPNAGSFFKNPVVGPDHYDALRREWPNAVAYPQKDGRWKLAAGWLIEQAGWKGRNLGPVGMHQRQALVLVNYGGANAADVQRLADRVRGDVRARFDVSLEQEPVNVC